MVLETRPRTHALAEAKPKSPCLNTVFFVLCQADLMSEEEKASAPWSSLNAAAWGHRVEEDAPNH